jgi:hypothetical protein
MAYSKHFNPSQVNHHNSTRKDDKTRYRVLRKSQWVLVHDPTVLRYVRESMSEDNRDFKFWLICHGRSIKVLWIHDVRSIASRRHWTLRGVSAMKRARRFWDACLFALEVAKELYSQTPRQKHSEPIGTHTCGTAREKVFACMQAANL